MDGAVEERETLVLNSLLEKVYREGGYDFRDYKRGTVKRRLERRLYATGTRTYLDYMQFLDSLPEEYQRFAEYLTIKTSGFFRSPRLFNKKVNWYYPNSCQIRENMGSEV